MKMFYIKTFGKKNFKFSLMEIGIVDDWIGLIKENPYKVPIPNIYLLLLRIIY